MRRTTQLRLALLVSILCFAGMILGFGQLLGAVGAFRAGPGPEADEPAPTVSVGREYQAELEGLRARCAQLTAEQERLSATVAEKEKVIVKQKEALANLAEQLRLRPAAP